MAQSIKQILMTIDSSGSTMNEQIVVKQYDTRSRFLGVFLVDENNNAYNLTNHEVKFYAHKPDGFDIRQVGVITDAVNGAAIIELTNQCLAVEGIVQAEISLWQDGGASQLTSLTFEIKVEKSIRNDDAVISTNEFNDLVVLMQQYWEFHTLLQSISDRLGVPMSEYDTIFGLLDFQAYSISGIHTTLGNQTDAPNLNSGSNTSTIISWLKGISTKLDTISSNITTVKSIQRGITQMTSSMTTLVNIATVVPSKTELKIISFTDTEGSSAASISYTPLMELNPSGNQISFTQGYALFPGATGGDNRIRVSWEVKENY